MAVQIECFSFLTTHIVVCESKVELLFSNSAFLIQKITQAELGSTYVMVGAPILERLTQVSLFLRRDEQDRHILLLFKFN